MLLVEHYARFVKILKEKDARVALKQKVSPGF